MTLRVRFESDNPALVGQPLAAIGFGTGTDRLPCPVAAPVAMPPLAHTPALEKPMVEIWESDRPVTYHTGDIPMAEDGEFLFGVLSATDHDRVAETTEALYIAMLQQVEATAYKRLLRIWHYIPHITTQIDAGERYHLFNQGRQSALDRAPQYAIPPAASALGTDGGKLTIIFVAARTDGIAIENPRQISAYHYPPQYGPRPRFSRAMLVKPTLFISGTASIIGHETKHLDDIAAQTGEMIQNLQALLTEAEKKGGTARRLAIKAYIRHARDTDLVRAALNTAFPGADLACLRADICRDDLLVEAEATAF